MSGKRIVPFSLLVALALPLLAACGLLPAAPPSRDLERWHRAVRRGLWVAPEPRPISNDLH